MSADPENEYFCDGITEDIINALTKLKGLRIDGRRLRVSQDGGTSPAWSPDGRELFYRNGEAMMAASFAADALSIVGRRSLFEGAYLTANGRNYDVAPSGDRFLMVKRGATSGMRSSGDDLHLVTDWFEELKARVPIN